MRATVLATGLAVAVLASGACRQQEEAEAPPVMTVDVAPVLLSSIQQTVRTDAVLFPKQQAAIVPKVTAPVRVLHVQKGSRVKAGQLLLELESRDLAGAAAESRASAQLADATYETTARGAVPQELQKAELDVRAGKDALDAAQAAFNNRQALFKEGAIAQKDVNDAQVALSQARASYESARKRLEDLQSFGHDQELKAAAAQREAARARDQAAQAQLGYTRITSPIDGVVTDLPFYPGESAPSGAPVVTVMDVSQMVARAHVAQADVARLAVGNAAHIIGPDGVPVDATVTQISPALDPGGTTVEVWAQAENTDGKLRAGATVRVELIARTVANALVIPEAAVLTASTGSTFVIVIDNENRPHLRKITVGVRDSGNAEVTEGLENGQRVATTGAYEIFKLDDEVRDKVTVKVAPPKEEDEDPDET
ncbi:MAG: efflux RND transporter periplasmic adaptor subunit [Acidobacteria bacterium]|nr:efflux RND transporter periplasmic adaptor subunit [Acidobacteriota bacterium]